jgi:dTMP kinase
MKGKLISFEGGEGSGKSTQAKKLFEYLQSNNIPSLLTREPGGTPSAEKIRNILVTGKLDDLDKLSEVMLHYAARNEHLKKKILPALAEGKIVITDRFYDSTIAYQGYGHKVDLKTIEQVHKLVVGDFKPNLTFIFDIDAEKGLARSGKRHVQENSDENRYENIPLDFHKRLRDGFLAIAKAEPERCMVINAEENIDTLEKQVWSIVNKNLKLIA